MWIIFCHYWFLYSRKRRKSIIYKTHSLDSTVLSDYYPILPLYLDGAIISPLLAQFWVITHQITTSLVKIISDFNDYKHNVLCHLDLPAMLCMVAHSSFSSNLLHSGMPPWLFPHRTSLIWLICLHTWFSTRSFIASCGLYFLAISFY